MRKSLSDDVEIGLVERIVLGLKLLHGLVDFQLHPPAEASFLDAE